MTPLGEELVEGTTDGCAAVIHADSLLTVWVSWFVVTLIKDSTDRTRIEPPGGEETGLARPLASIRWQHPETPPPCGATVIKPRIVDKFETLVNRRTVDAPCLQFGAYLQRPLTIVTAGAREHLGKPLITQKILGDERIQDRRDAGSRKSPSLKLSMEFET